MSINQNIGVESFYQDLRRMCENVESISPTKFYTSLRRLFFLALDDCTKEEEIAFSGPLAKLDFLCKEHRTPRRVSRAMKRFRAKVRSISTFGDDELRKSALQDARLLTEFFSNIYQRGIPKSLDDLLPEHFEEAHSIANQTVADSIRVVVNSWDERSIFANRTDDCDDELTICYALTPEEVALFNVAGDFTGIKPILTKGCQLNIIRPKLREGVFFPELIVFEPDFLVDISTISESFEEYGLTPLSYLIKRLKPRQTTQPILIGNLAGQFLDEAVYNEEPSSYKESVTRFFRQNALSLVTCPEFDSGLFHSEAKRQQSNLATYTQKRLDGQRIFDPEKTLLEPSFFCEMLGLQGRMDLLHDDKRLLIEQKSGKWGFPNGGHQEKHYVQMLFYLAWIKYTQRLTMDEVNALLLYSKYPTEGKTVEQENGLIKEGPAPRLLFDAMMLRNYIVHLEMMLLRGEVTLLDTLEAEQLNLNKKGGTLWNRYQRPEIEKVLKTIQEAEPTAKEYFFRFFTFLEREYHLSKNAFALAWNTSMEEKCQDGTAYFDLQIDSIEEREEQGGGIEFVKFAIAPEAQANLPNFRKGDIVVFYSYRKGESADICKDIVFRATLTQMSKEFLTVKLRAPQRNRRVFQQRKGFVWAMEHDFIDSSFASSIKELFSFLSMKNESRRNLILSQRAPMVNHDRQLNGDYGKFNNLVLKAKQAEDYFLVIGPPGTGKTSFALVNILKETLSDPSASVLLASYTNRAVEEICSKLIKEEIDFIRIGHEHSCTESFDTKYLLKNKIGSLVNVQEIRNALSQTRVFVGTTAAISSSSNLFDLKSFDLAIIDEASQILEPQLIGLLAAGDGRAIRKFVFIGDHKQLPAVVQQSENESRVTSERLQAIGLTNCRYSFFERLLKLQRGNDELVYLLDRQGRMHPDISAYINQNYYAGLLTSVPLAHQQKSRFFDELAETSVVDAMQDLLAKRRLVCFDLPSVEDNTADNVNLPEARLIARLTHQFWQLYQTSGKPFRTDSSIGIIVPYRAQIATVRQELEQLGIDELKEVAVDTVERYQGSERDVIIYGTTIRKHSQLDFLTGNQLVEAGARIDRKLNVAITRAREEMVFIGDISLLQETPSYRHFIRYLQENDCIYNPDQMP